MRWEGAIWINLAQDREYWLTRVKAVMNLVVPFKVKNVFSSLATVSFLITTSCMDLVITRWSLQTKSPVPQRLHHQNVSQCEQCVRELYEWSKTCSLMSVVSFQLHPNNFLMLPPQSPYESCGFPGSEWLHSGVLDCSIFMKLETASYSETSVACMTIWLSRVATQTLHICFCKSFTKLNGVLHFPRLFCS
jgi:hypothetical protein